nr:hypothetical protein [Candidatus Sigynarchaeota archaeon]
AKSLNSYGFVELSCKTRRALTREERLNPDLLPPGSRRFKTISLHSQGFSAGRTVPFSYNGRTLSPPPNRHWVVSVDVGMKWLGDANRIYDAGDTFLYIYYLDDFPIKLLSNIWDDTLVAKNGTACVDFELVLDRIILMTSKPGDIVASPVDGPGIASITCEKWGRRWIAGHQSKAVIDAARDRLIGARFDYYPLKRAGNDFDFTYKEYQHITQKTIAYGLDIMKEPVISQPIKEPGKARVAGPFSIEHLAEAMRGG